MFDELFHFSLLPVMGCRYLESPVNGQLLVSGRVVGSTATYSCNTGFSLVGRHVQRTCQDNGVWSGEEPHCAAEQSKSMYHRTAILMTPYLLRVSSHQRMQKKSYIRL